MKKKYVEPVMVVEDFTVSEMVAANCKYTPENIGLVQQMSKFQPACGSGYYPDDPQKGQDYMMFSELFNAEYDLDGNPMNGPENVFTSAFHEWANDPKNTSEGNVASNCSFDPFEKGITFGHNTAYVCLDDDADAELLQNS